MTTLRISVILTGADIGEKNVAKFQDKLSQGLEGMSELFKKNLNPWYSLQIILLEDLIR